MNRSTTPSPLLLSLLVLGLPVLATPPAAAQKVVNMSLLSQLDIAALGADNSCNVGAIVVPVNEAWGWDGPAGEAFALVGMCNGTAIVDVANPAAPVLLHTVPGPLSVWRDVKTFDHYAYIVHDVLDSDDPTGVGVGVQIVDLVTPGFPVVSTLSDGFTRAHNVFVDEVREHLYVVGWDPDAASLVGDSFHPEGEAGFSHGFRIYDLSADPETPVLLGIWDEEYVHDLHVRGNTVYAAALDEGLWFVDVTNPALPVTLDHVTYTQTVGGGSIDQFTHNTWADEAGAVAVVTDEEVSQRVKFLDVSPVGSAAVISEYEAKPGILPHNAFLLGGRAYISYYSEGAVILDISDPTQPCEIGYYDTFLGASVQNGAWGIYPFAASGLIYVSDISGGLFVLEFDPPAHDPVDMALVLDVSGSMGSSADGGPESRLDVLKDAVEMFIQTWRAFTVPEDRMGLVYFESDVDTAFLSGGEIATRFCPNHAELLADVQAATTGNLTALGGGLLTADRSFQAGPQPKVSIIVTDGMQNRSPMVVDAGLEMVFFDLGDTLVNVPDLDGPWPSLPGAEALVANLKAAGIRVGIISNSPAGWDLDDVRDRMANPLFFDEFELVILSSLEGVSKPDPVIFENSLAALSPGLPASHVAFVTETLGHLGDDADTPTVGARAVGMVGIHLSPGAPNPQADHTVATHAQILDIILDSALPARHEVLTVPSGSGIYGDSGVPGEPGVALADLGPTIHTIGIGTAPGSSWQDLIADIATETGGLHHFTSAPGADLEAFLEDDLVIALQSGSVYRVDRATGSLGRAEQASHDFALNPTISKLAARLSWRGPRRRGFVDLALERPGSAPPLAPSNIVEGEQYRIYTWDFPVWDGDSSIEPGGNWRVRLAASDQLETGESLDYSLSILVDDSHLKTRFELPDGALTAGRPVPFEATVTLDGQALSDVLWIVSVDGPKSGLGTALVDRGPVPPSGDPDSEEFDAVDLRLRELIRDPSFSALLEGRESSITLAETAAGSYKGSFAATDVAGSYRFDWTAEGTVSGEPFRRSGTAFRTVGLGPLENTEFELTRNEANVFTLRVVPADAHGNLLGPGYASRVRVAVPGVGPIASFEDRGDGSYETRFELADPASFSGVRVLVDRQSLQLPDETIDPFLLHRAATWSFHFGSAHPEGALSLVASDGYSLGVDVHCEGARWWPGLRFNGSFLDARAGATVDFVTLHPEVQRRLGPTGKAFLELGAGADWIDGNDVEFGVHFGAGVELSSQGAWRFELGVRLFDAVTASTDLQTVAVQLGLIR